LKYRLANTTCRLAFEVLRSYTKQTWRRQPLLRCVGSPLVLASLPSRQQSCRMAALVRRPAITRTARCETRSEFAGLHRSPPSTGPLSKSFTAFALARHLRWSGTFRLEFSAFAVGRDLSYNQPPSLRLVFFRFFFFFSSSLVLAGNLDLATARPSGSLNSVAYTTPPLEAKLQQ